MNNISNQFKNLCETSVALTQARAAHSASTQQLFSTVGPILREHQEVIGELFDNGGFKDRYVEQFGTIQGNQLQSIGADESHLRVHVNDYFRGECETSTFMLPRKYLTRDPAEQLAADIAYYRAVFNRMASWREQREIRENHERDLQEFARLSALLGNDSVSAKTLGAAAPRL